MKKDLHINDLEFMERHEAFLEEVENESGQQLDTETRWMAILASLIGCQGICEYQEVLAKALKEGLAPVIAKEIVYQAVAYLGTGRVNPFLRATNDVMETLGVQLPLDDQATTTMEDRLEKGAQAQVDIFGAGMKDFWKGGHINRWLAANCFGDYYTRAGLALKQRELITFCFLMAQGGCESQLLSHIAGNANVGNSPEFLSKVVSQCLPYIGYPRSLNALASIKQITDRMAGAEGK